MAVKLVLIYFTTLRYAVDSLRTRAVSWLSMKVLESSPLFYQASSDTRVRGIFPLGGFIVRS
jgi:hypothetical protein